MKTLLFVLAALTAVSSLASPKLSAEELAKRRAEFSAMTPEQRAERRAQVRARMEARNGGTVIDKSRQKGRILVAVDQREVAISALKASTARIVDILHVTIDVEEVDAPELARAKDFLWDNKANLVVAVVNKPSQPALLVAPEERWAQVNVAALNGSAVTIRVQKEVARAIAFLSGAASTSYVETLVSPITSIQDLDRIEGYTLPIDSIRAMEPYLKGLGIAPWRQAYYRQACKEGWAPAPTNDVQKAIWNEIHAPPTDPLKITFDPKTDTK